MIYQKDLYALARVVKQHIHDDYRAFEDDEVPGIKLTIGWNPKDNTWSFQTGDNSCTGGAYGYPIWAVTGVYRDSNCLDIAKDLINQLYEQIEYRKV
jgi:hypothetical protein